MPFLNTKDIIHEEQSGQTDRIGQNQNQQQTNAQTQSTGNTQTQTLGTANTTGTTQSNFNTSPTFAGGAELLQVLTDRLTGGGGGTGQSGTDYYNQLLQTPAGEGGFIDELISSIHGAADFNLPGELNQARGRFLGRGPGGRTALGIDEAVTGNRLRRDALAANARQNQYNADLNRQSGAAGQLIGAGESQTGQGLALLNALRGQSGASAQTQDQSTTTSTIQDQQQERLVNQLVDSLSNSVFSEQTQFTQEGDRTAEEGDSIVNNLGVGLQLGSILTDFLGGILLPQ